MPYRIPKFITGNYYHVYNRGVAKMPIFLFPQDYRVFMGLMFYHVRTRREKRVELLSYCLMPNHFHLLLQQSNDYGISKYIQAFLIGYSMYFNYLHERVGPLYQGRTKSRLMQNDVDLVNTSRYIHRNPNKILESNQTLLAYPYSSFSHYVQDKTASYSKILSFFNNDPKIYESFVLFESKSASPDLLPY